MGVDGGAWLGLINDRPSRAAAVEAPLDGVQEREIYRTPHVARMAFVRSPQSKDKQDTAAPGGKSVCWLRHMALKGTDDEIKTGPHGSSPMRACLYLRRLPSSDLALGPAARLFPLLI